MSDAPLSDDEDLVERFWEEYLEIDQMSDDHDRKLRSIVERISTSHADSREYGFYHMIGLCIYGLSEQTSDDLLMMEVNFAKAHLLSDGKGFNSLKFLLFVYYDTARYQSHVALFEMYLSGAVYDEIDDGRLVAHGLYINSLIHTGQPEAQILSELNRWISAFDQFERCEDNDYVDCGMTLPVDFLTMIGKLSDQQKAQFYIGKLSPYAEFGPG